KIPEDFPVALNVTWEDEEEADAFWDIIDDNQYSSLIYSIFKAYTDVYGFYVAYVADLILDDMELFDSPAENIEPSLLALAASKVEVDSALASNFSAFKYKIERDYEY